MIKYFIPCSFIIILIYSCTSNEHRQLRESSSLSSTIAQSDSVSTTELEDFISEYESDDRDNWQHPEVILAFIGDLKGKTVADIGAGTGYFSFKLAKTADTVYAIEIEKRFIEYIEERKEGLQYGLGQNVVAILTSPSDPGLSSTKVDVVLLVNTYSYINDRIEYFSKVKKSLKKGAFLCIVDFKEKSSPIGPPDDIKISSETAILELKKAGFKQFKVDLTSLPYQYILKAS